MNYFKFLAINGIVLILLTLGSSTVWGDDAANRFTAAKSLFDLKQYEQARTAFDAFIAQYPNHAQTTEATYYLAESLLYLKQYVLAENYYQRLTASGLDNSFAKAALFRLADIPYLQGLFNIAKPRLEEFVEKLPHDNNLQYVLYYLGDIAMRNSTTENAAEEAEWYFGQCDRMFPNGAKSLENKIGLAWAKNQLGNITEANAIFQQLMNSSEPLVVETATYQWGVTLFERGNFQEAIAILSEFQKRWAKSQYYTDSMRVLARCKGGLGNYNEALQLFSQISPLTFDDNLVKVRCLYGLKQIQQAQNLLAEIERANNPVYRDEVALLKSVFLFEQRNWQQTIFTLESFLLPQYNTLTGQVMFNYLTQPPQSGVQKLNDESFMKACSLLAQAYAKNGDSVRANAIVREMQNQAVLLGHSELYAIVTETTNQLAGTTDSSKTSQNPFPSGSWSGRNPAGSLSKGQSSGGRGQWTPNGQRGSGGQGTQNGSTNTGQWTSNNGSGRFSERQQSPTTQGTDLDRFWRASQFYDQKNYSAAAQQLEQILATQYNQWTTPKQYYINYNVTGAEGTLNEITLVKACSLLALSKAQLGDIEQANAIFSALSTRVRLSDTVQKNLFQETRDQLTELVKNPNALGTSGTGITAQPLLSESEQRKIIRDCNSLYKTKRYEQVDSKLLDLIAQKPEESIFAEALLLRSKAVYQLGKEREAVILLEKIVDGFSSSPQYQDALWFLGIYYDSYGDTIKSVDYFQLLADHFPNSKHIDGALYFLALDDLQNGNGRKATTYLIRIYRNYQAGEHWSHAAWTLAYEAYKKKDYAQAEIYLQKLLQHPPDIVILDRALYLKGELSLRKNEYETAFIAFRDLGKLCPESPLCHEAAKNAHIAAGKTTNIK
ncbi:MAG: tetratricopeptide repeat protein [Planctomycetaceae bacterium]|jgi:TolA-binding protein|nr:tetratricopeptide repeat protein [Planctomycetaceae bacterium]